MHSYGTIVINGLENCKLDSEKEIKINAYMDIVGRSKYKKFSISR